MRSDTLVALTLGVFMETKRILVFQLAVLGQEAFRSTPCSAAAPCPGVPSLAPCCRVLLQHPGGISLVPLHTEMPKPVLMAVPLWVVFQGFWWVRELYFGSAQHFGLVCVPISTQLAS